MTIPIVKAFAAGEVLDYSDVTDRFVEISVSNQGLRFTEDEITVRNARELHRHGVISNFWRQNGRR